jgi:uncharacterized protein YndB with AHSA1/START domain
VSLEHSYSIYIKASPEQVWEALTTPSFTTRYFPGGAVKSDWQEGSDYTMNSADGAKVLYDGRVVVSHRLRRLVQTVNIKFDPSVIGHEEMTIEWDIERFGETCLLTMIHRGADSVANQFGMLTSHCPDLMSGIKTLLETGQPLQIGERVEAGV